MSRSNHIIVIERASLTFRQVALLALVCLPLAASGCRLVSQGQNTAGVQLYQQGQYQAAVHRFQQSIATDPLNSNSYYNLAATYHQMGKLDRRQDELDQAESFYNQCLDHDPNHTECYRALAVLLCEQGRQDRAQKLLEGWAQRNPTLAAPNIELARLSQEFGNHEKAKGHLLDAIENDPQDHRARAALAALQEQTGDHAQALANYERSLASNRFQPGVVARRDTLRTAMASTQPQYPASMYPPGTIIPAPAAGGPVMVTSPGTIR